MTDTQIVSSPPDLDQVMVLRRRLDAAEALARERLKTIETLEWDRDRLRADLEQEPPPASLTPAEPPEVSAGPAAGGPGLRRRMALALYRVVRPVLRPVAWRVRQFLVGELRHEIAAIHAQQELLLNRSKNGTGTMDAAFVASIERLLLTLAMEQGRDCTRAGPGAGLSKADSDG